MLLQTFWVRPCLLCIVNQNCLMYKPYIRGSLDLSSQVCRVCSAVCNQPKVLHAQAIYEAA